MPTLVEALRQHGHQEPLPEWLDGEGDAAFDRQRFFASRTVYYPGCGFDGHPVKLCSLSHAAHSFVYVDYGIGEASVMEELCHPKSGFHGYDQVHTEYVSEEALRPGGWTAHVEPREVANAGFAGEFAKPFARFVVLGREEGLDCRHGPRRLAILFVGGDGFATYDALYCQGDGMPAPFMIVLQDYSFDGNYDRFGRGGLLERIALRCRVRPEMLLADNAEPWDGYDDVGADAEVGGRYMGPRRLFRRRAG